MDIFIPLIARPPDRRPEPISKKIKALSKEARLAPLTQEQRAVLWPYTGKKADEQKDPEPEGNLGKNLDVTV